MAYGLKASSYHPLMKVLSLLFIRNTLNFYAHNFLSSSSFSYIAIPWTSGSLVKGLLISLFQ